MIRYVAIIIKDNDYVNVLTNIAKHVINFVQFNPIYPEVVDEFVLKEFIIDSLKLYIKWSCNKKKESEIEFIFNYLAKNLSVHIHTDAYEHYMKDDWDSGAVFIDCEENTINLF